MAAAQPHPPGRLSTPGWVPDPIILRLSMVLISLSFPTFRLICLILFEFQCSAINLTDLPTEGFCEARLEAVHAGDLQSSALWDLDQDRCVVAHAYCNGAHLRAA